MKTNHMKAAWALAGVLASIVAAVPGRALAACGDGVIDGIEGCDDGNLANLDGCSSLCVAELGYTCSSQPRIPLVNASFESTITAVSSGWVLSRGSIDQVDDSSGCYPPADMNLSVDLNGSTKGEIYQDVTTAIGQRYVLTMLGSANCIEFGGQLCSRTCEKVLTISAADVAAPDSPFTTRTYSLAGNPSSQGWTEIRFDFVATSTTTRLRLTGSDPSFAGPMVDRAAIPESVCVSQACGNGTLGGSETCDDGNTNSGDGCSAFCTTEVGYTCATPGSPCSPTCGDGVRVVTEACDDGGTMDGDGCSATCTPEFGYTCATDLFYLFSLCTSTCGDGDKASNEDCDDGDTTGGDGCSDVCTIETGYGCSGTMPSACSPVCGDGIVLAPEACDDDDTVPGDGCSATCTEESGYTCSGMPSSCTLLAVCGDGLLGGTEACDDGNAAAGDGCSATCTEESGYTCSMQGAVTLDDGSFESDFSSGSTGWQLLSGSVDRVSSSQDGACWPAGDQTFSVDLNGSTRGQIYQDFTTTISARYVVTLLASANCRAQPSDACNLSCTRLLSLSASPPGLETTPTANAAFDVAGSPQTAGWEPIRFEFVATSTTTRLVLSGSDPSLAGPMVDRVAIAASVCTPNACGNGSVDVGETCDDGNGFGSDGCSSTCEVVENGYTCPTPGAACAAVCGDGLKLPSEACDDGNSSAGDGCSATCAVENGFACTLDLIDVISICVPFGVDAGVDSGMNIDSGVDTDAGTDAGVGMDSSVPTMSMGGAAGGAFGCSVSTRRGESLVWTASTLLGLVLVVRRRRR